MKRRFFQDKVAIVTGSSMGIGKATALALAEKGAKVVINGRNAVRLQATYQELLNKGYAVAAVGGDVSVYEDCQKIVREAVDHFGKIDILINNAGKSSRGYVEELSPEVFREMMEINFLGCVYPTQCALPYLKASRGSLVFISSVAGIRGLPETSAYCASKMALTSLSESLKVELHSAGVHVGIVYVGITKNDPGKTVIHADGSLRILEGRDQAQAQTPGQVAQAVLKHVRKRKFKKVLSRLGKINRITNLLFPRLVDRVLVKSLTKIRKMNR